MKKLIKEIKENKTLEMLQEVGYIDIDEIEGNLNKFVMALEEVTGKTYTIRERVGKRVLEEK